jgi:hypothetical protein
MTAAHRFSPSADWRIDDADAGNMTVHIGSTVRIRDLRMQSVSRDLLSVNAGHLRTTAVAITEFLGGASEGQVPW